MKNIHITIYTKEHGKLDLTSEEMNHFNFDKVTRHRTDGPAVIYYYEDGSVEREYYFINNKRHRTDGFAAIWYYQDGSVLCEYYYINEKHHRLDGPSIIYYYNQDGSINSEYYYINNTCYSKEEYDNLINEMKALPKSLRLIHELWWVREL